MESRLDVRLRDQLGAAEAHELRDVLDRLTAGARSALDGDFVGSYLVGSFAYGAGDVHSDVDFLVVTTTPPEGRQEARIRTLHRGLPDLPSHWAQHLEGTYVAVAELRAIPGSRAGWLYVDNGQREMERSHHDDTPMMRWVLHRGGLAIEGPPAEALVDPVPAADLRRAAIQTAAEWVAFLDADPDDPVAGVADAWAQTHAVTALCRILFTGYRGEIAGKNAAATWALDQLGEDWQPLLRRAIADRADPWKRTSIPADPASAALTPAFARFVAAEVGRVVGGLTAG